MLTYFYIRVSSANQNIVLQEVKAQELNIPIENVYIERQSGKNITERPVLQAMMQKLHYSDLVVVDSISGFARNTVDLLELVHELTERGCQFKSLAENIDTSTPQGEFMLTVFGAMAQLERSYSKARQREGIEQAKLERKYKGRKPIGFPKGWDKTFKMYEDKSITGDQMMKMFNLKPTTFYKLLKQYRNTNGYQLDIENYTDIQSK